MRREVALWCVGTLLLLCVAGGFFLSGTAELEGSSLSRGPTGYLLARRYLEARGCRVTLLDRSPDGEFAPGVLALVFPWQVEDFDPEELRRGLEAHLRRGGTLLLAVSGESLVEGQGLALAALGLDWKDLRGRPPLLPWRWWTFANLRWPMSAPDATGEVQAPRGFPVMPKEGRAWWSGEGGVPLVFSFPRSRGLVVVLPADALTNGRIGRAQNADLLEQLRLALGDRWAFDEYHHALLAPATPTSRVGVAALEALLLHLGLVYAMAVLAMVRPFGPSWTGQAVPSGSTASFLVGLGALHQRLGHHAAAARLLVERAQELDRRVRLPALEGPVLEGRAFARLGARVAEAQARKGGG